MRQITRVERLLEDLRRAAAESGMTKTELARAAKLHVNTLSRLDDPSWRPSYQTMRALERALSHKMRKIPSASEETASLSRLTTS